MKKVFITTKRQADKLVVESLFKPYNGKTLSIGRYDNPELSALPKAIRLNDLLGVTVGDYDER